MVLMMQMVLVITVLHILVFKDLVIFLVEVFLAVFLATFLTDLATLIIFLAFFDHFLGAFLSFDGLDNLLSDLNESLFQGKFFVSWGGFDLFGSDLLGFSQDDDFLDDDSNDFGPC